MLHDHVHTATGMDLMDLSVRMGNIVMIIGPGARMAESQIWETNLTVMLVSIGLSVNKSTVFMGNFYDWFLCMTFTVGQQRL